jgi:hypothetical protein
MESPAEMPGFSYQLVLVRLRRAVKLREPFMSRIIQHSNFGYWKHIPKRLVVSVVLVLPILLYGQPAASQPAPSFRSSCEELRSNIKKLQLNGNDLVTIQVVGQLTGTQKTDAAVYLFMCQAPAPRVLCVTYELDKLKQGDQVVLTGAITMPDANHVLLDPCLHHPADRR